MKGEVYMQCPVCSHENEGGNFCEQCGAKLNPSAYQETAATVEGSNRSSQVNTQPNQYLEGAKHTSKLFFSYFIKVLKSPYTSSQSVGEDNFINAIITIILYSLIIPLMTYFGLKSLLSAANGITGMFGVDTSSISPSFLNVVIKPTIAYAIFVLLVATFTFAAIKLGKVKVSFKNVISRFGSFLIPFVAILLVALIMALLEMKTFLVVLFFGFITSLFLVPPLVIASFKKESHSGLDVIYGTLLTYLLTIITISIMGKMMFDALLNSFSSIFSVF